MVQTWTTLPRRARRPLVSGLALLLALGTLYTGYCYGWWGRNNLFLQYLFQCHSPPGSEQVRYAEFTVLAPACRWPEVEAMLADGRYLLITEHAAPVTTYRLRSHDRCAPAATGRSGLGQRPGSQQSVVPDE